MSTMIYAQLTPSGDMVFPQGPQDFYVNIQACAQAIWTRLRLLTGSFWRDLSDGLPLFQSILGARASAANLQQIDTIISNRITGTPNVTNLISYNSTFNGNTRQYSFTCQVQTAYSSSPITIASAPFVPGEPPTMRFFIIENSQYISLL